MYFGGSRIHLMTLLDDVVMSVEAADSERRDEMEVNDK